MAIKDIFILERGLKNFLNDLIKGKDRYQGIVFRNLMWSIDPDNEQLKILKDKDNYYANILYAKISKHYLLRIDLPDFLVPIQSRELNPDC